MRTRIGMEAEGRVIEILPMSVIVSLDEPFVDVRVTEEMIGRDAYEASDDGLRMVGQRSGDTITLGERMRVRVEEVSLTRRIILGRRIVPEGRRARGEKKPAERGKNRAPHDRKPLKTKRKRS